MRKSPGANFISARMPPMRLRNISRARFAICDDVAGGGGGGGRDGEGNCACCAAAAIWLFVGACASWRIISACASSLLIDLHISGMPSSELKLLGGSPIAISFIHTLSGSVDLLCG